MNYEVQGVRPRDRPKNTWSEVIRRLPDPTNARKILWIIQKWRKLMKDVVVTKSGCEWYRLTWVILDQGQLKRLQLSLIKLNVRILPACI